VRYLSVCSGIEAATVAWHPLGWTPAAFSEIEPFPRAVLAHHYPEVPCHGDFTTIGADEYGPVQLLVGGTPCQSFSVAGLRGGLGDDRGNLALEYLRLADRKRPRWLVWENVPGVLSSNGGRDFGAILGGMVELGYGIAYRVLDAQFFGVPQRRRRVFVVGYLGDWRRAAAVLFERHSLSGHPAPRREKGQGIAAATAPSLTASGRGVERTGESRGQDPVVAVAFGGNNTAGPIDVATAVNAHGGPHGRQDFESETFVASIQERAVSENPDAGPDGAGFRTDEQAYTLEARSVPQAVAWDFFQITAPVNRQNRKPGDPCHTLAKDNADRATLVMGSAVRRLTPRECERLQGFPDDYTLVPYRGKPAADGPRYKALGNSFAVPVVRWLGERIQMVENLERAVAA
jgi:DNA (cytosine-5)-methyltransferase 1